MSIPRRASAPQAAAAKPAPPGFYNSTVLIHLGYPKTASTLLQQHVFDSAARGCCTPWATLESHTPGRSHIARRWTDDGFSDREVAGAQLKRGIAEAAEAGLTPVLSEETLVGYIGDPGFDTERVHRLLDLADAADPAGAYRLLLCIREQRSMLRSAYAQSIIDGNTGTWHRFLRGPRERTRFRDIRQIGLPYLRYGGLIDLLQQRVGPQRLTVLPLELLRADAAAFAAGLARATGRPLSAADVADTPRVNTRPAAAELSVMRRLNRIWPRRGPYELRALTGRFSIARAMATGRRGRSAAGLRVVPADIAEGFRADNRRLAELTGLDLAGLGYLT